MPHRNGLGATVVVIVVVVVIIIGTVGFALLTSQPTVSTTASTTPPTTSTSSGGHPTMNLTTSASGLQLRLSINANEVNVGGAIQANVSEFNTLDSANNVTKSGEWRIQAALSSCPNTDIRPFGIAVYQGHYTAQNVSQGSQLQIFPPTACPMYVRLVAGYLFQPDSDLATVLPGTGLTPMAARVSVVNGTSTGSGQLLSLNPGLYTVAAADEWGGLVFLYFQVNGLP